MIRKATGAAACTILRHPVHVQRVIILQSSNGTLHVMVYIIYIFYYVQTKSPVQLNHTSWTLQTVQMSSSWMLLQFYSV